MSFHQALAAESPSMSEALEAGLQLAEAREVELAYREADAAAVAFARVYREAGYPGFETASGRAYMGACRRLEVASSARYALREGE